ncbi:MAG: [FeFe] hydrogenase H-cluster radical SAM maturase HydE [Planctomycetota bacterium]
MNRERIKNRLLETDPHRLEQLWREADAVRRENVGDEVHLRGLIEISNYCTRTCAYCGISARREGLPRYRMSNEEILASAGEAERLGYGTVVIQAGEDPQLTGDRVAELVEDITEQTDLAVTLSLGERCSEDLARWRRAGADRYLLRFETSNEQLYARLHADDGRRLHERLAVLAELRRLDYEVGSGCMVGIPGQTCDDLARDIEMFEDLELDMIGLGPFIPHPETPLAAAAPAAADQAPNTELMSRKMVALTRIVRPASNIPATTALATLNTADGRESALKCGANVVMPNVTPPRYRPMYEIYPDKACIAESADDCSNCIRGRIASIGRRVGTGQGASPSYLHRHAKV